MGQERTWTYCWSKYFNVTQQLVRIYCETCVACCKKNPVGNTQKGSRKPIILLNWRSRFEIDLMDFRKLQKRDPFGVFLHWILNLKDHATLLVYLSSVDPIIDLLSLIVSRTFQLISIHLIVSVSIKCYN
jgi:hypothetical protein